MQTLWYLRLFCARGFSIGSSSARTHTHTATPVCAKRARSIRCCVVVWFDLTCANVRTFFDFDCFVFMRMFRSDMRLFHDDQRVNVMSTARRQRTCDSHQRCLSEKTKEESVLRSESVIRQWFQSLMYLENLLVMFTCSESDWLERTRFE